MALITKIIYDGKAKGIYHPGAFDTFMTSDLPAQIGGEQIVIQVRKNVNGGITTYSLAPLGVKIPYEHIEGNAVVGAVGSNAYNLERVVEAIVSSAHKSIP